MNFFTVKNEFKPFYDLLKKVGVFYEDPYECAKKVNSICHDPMEWWMSDEIQNAKQLYLDNICKFSNNLEENLANKINEYRYEDINKINYY